MTTAADRPDRTTPDYTFDNNHPNQADRHAALAGILDEFTASRLASLGDLSGRRCLELGAGVGSIAGWLADQAGPAGEVLATDLNTRHLHPDRGYAVMAHDLTTDPIPDGPWDLIHARLVLSWLPEPENILRRLAAVLAPGGTLAIEEWDDTYPTGHVLTVPEPEAAAMFNAYQATLKQILAADGLDLGWAWQMHAAMTTAGLVDIDTVVHAKSWPGGSPGAMLHAASIDQLAGKFVAAGMTEQQLHRLRAHLRDPKMVLRGMLTISTIGRRAAA